MTDINAGMQDLMQVDGAMGIALVDYGSGMLLSSSGGGVDLELAAGGNTEVVRAKVKTLKMLGLDDGIEDILITLGRQYHLIRPLSNSRDLFLYYVLDKSRANLAMARRQLMTIGTTLEV